MHHTPEACSLAASILKDLFGVSVSDVCRVLLEKGAMTLNALGRFSGKQMQEVRDCLLVLIQHSCVECYLLPNRQVNRPPYIYRARLDHTLQNLRKPWFLMHVKSEFDGSCEHIIEALLENGRLRMQQVMAFVARKTETDASDITEDVLSCFARLIESQLIERCPPCTLPQSIDPVKRSQKKISESEKAAAKALTAYEKDRFRPPMKMLLESATGTTSRKRKQSKQSSQDETDEQKILWRINFEAFNRNFLYKACIDFASSKISHESAFALRCILEASKSNDQSLMDFSRPVSLEDITKAFEAMTDEMDSDAPYDLETALTALKEDQLELVTYTGEHTGGSAFCVNLKRIVECCQLIHLEAVIRDRFGIKALRIFRLLLLKGQLEQKQIADLTMLDFRETRTMLYRMLKAGYVNVQDIPQTNDRAASRTFYSWRVRLQDATSQLRKDIYKATLNTHLRLMHELHRGNELMELLEMAQSRPDPVRITDKQRTQAGKLSRIVQTLEKCLFDLDATIAIMSDRL